LYLTQVAAFLSRVLTPVADPTRKPSARQHTALAQVARENFLPTVKDVMWSGLSNTGISSAPCSPRQFHRHSLSEHECSVPLPKFGIEQDGGHQPSLSRHGHGLRRFPFAPAPTSRHRASDESDAASSLGAGRASDASFFTSSANCPSRSEWPATGACACRGHSPGP
jgi:hypothetical protein